MNIQICAAIGRITVVGVGIQIRGSARGYLTGLASLAARAAPNERSIQLMRMHAVLGGLVQVLGRGGEPHLPCQLRVWATPPSG